MNSGVVAALITGAVNLLAVIITSIATRIDIISKLDKQQAVFEAVVTERVGNLQKQVEKHNKVADKTADLEKTVAVQKTEIESLNDKIDKIERSKQ